MTRHHKLGTIIGLGSVFATVEIRRGERTTLSICGVIGPMSNGNAKGGCGQIHGTIRDEISNQNFKSAGNIDIKKFLDIWDRWHLNDMRPGTPEQQELVREYLKTNSYDYTAVCEYLKSIGKLEVPDPRNPDAIYKYGSAWLHEEIPTEVLEWLGSLPTNDDLPTAWQA